MTEDYIEQEENLEIEEKNFFQKHWKKIVYTGSYLFIIIIMNILKVKEVIDSWMFWLFFSIPLIVAIGFFIHNIINNKEQIKPIQQEVEIVTKNTKQECRSHVIKHMMYMGVELLFQPEKTKENIYTIGKKNIPVYYLTTLSYPKYRRWWCACRVDNPYMIVASDNEKEFKEKLQRIAEDYSKSKKVIRRFLDASGNPTSEEEIIEPQETIITVPVEQPLGD